MRSSVFGVIQRRTGSTALLRSLSLPDVIAPRTPPPPPPPLLRQFASRRTAADQDQHPDDNDDLAAARRWLSKLDVHTVPRHLCEIAFSRSGGPGGQNVNKIVHPQLLSSRYVAQRSNSLVIQSEESRKQASNVESCFEKLYLLLRSSAELAIPGETSQDQKDRVRGFIRKLTGYRKKAENESRIKAKKLLSSKKSSRRGSKDD